MSSDLIGLCVAGLRLWLDARGTGLCLAVPPSHEKFLQHLTKLQVGPTIAEIGDLLPVNGDLVLRVRNQSLPMDKICGARLIKTELWELWIDEVGRYVFVAPREVPPCRIVIDPGFSSGEVFRDFSSSNGTGLYPLESLEIRLIANWLAAGGDVILHAAGVKADGKGYCFAGSSGAGKSTLAAFFSALHPVTVLGEDNVILRCLDGQFWIYGTPWHENPAMCSPSGVPLEKLFFLERNAAQGVKRLQPVDGVARLLQTAFIPYYRPELVSRILDRLALLAKQVPFYSLSYRLGSDVGKLIRAA